VHGSGEMAPKQALLAVHEKWYQALGKHGAQQAGVSKASKASNIPLDEFKLLFSRHAGILSRPLQLLKAFLLAE